MSEKKEILFLSDFHLGAPNLKASQLREREIVSIIKKHESNLSHLYLLGDLFDFWFEYKTVVPKGFLRLLGYLSHLADKGIPITIFRGNHDVWMWDYFEKELGANIHSNSIDVEHFGYKLHLHHGDGLGPGDHGYKFIKKVFNAPFFQFLFKWLHPDLGVGLANFFSQKSSQKTRHKDLVYHGAEEEWIAQYCAEYLEKYNCDFLIFGHRHMPIKIEYPNKNATYFNLGDWLHHKSYGVLNDDGFKLISPLTEPKLGQIN